MGRVNEKKCGERRMRRHLKTTGLLASLLLTGCSGPLAEQLAAPSQGLLPPTLNPVTRTNETLRLLPPPNQRVAVAVYAYADQTGQFKPADTVQQLSRAVTQGATSVLIKALQDTGNGAWFMVVEREKLENLLKERRIIADMRNIYLGERSVNPQALPPLLFAGIILEGGIIGFDSNTRTGGAGARYLGIGGDVQYREDTVTVYLRVVSTKTGEVMLSVVAHKTILSVGMRGSIFKFVALDKILEAEAGFTTNEPEQIAVQQAIEKAVHAMVVEGSARNVWGFADKEFQSREISKLDGEQSLDEKLAGRIKPEGQTAVANAAAPAMAPATQNPVPATTARATATTQAKPATPATAAADPSKLPASVKPANAQPKAPAATVGSTPAGPTATASNVGPINAGTQPVVRQ
jgi:curli production assembly/transport component CsgG